MHFLIFHLFLYALFENLTGSVTALILANRKGSQHHCQLKSVPFDLHCLKNLWSGPNATELGRGALDPILNDEKDLSMEYTFLRVNPTWMKEHSIY